MGGKPTIRDHSLAHIARGFLMGGADIIPGVDSLWVENMGHDIPLIFLDEIINKISNHIDKSELKLDSLKTI